MLTKFVGGGGGVNRVCGGGRNRIIRGGGGGLTEFVRVGGTGCNLSGGGYRV